MSQRKSFEERRNEARELVLAIVLLALLALSVL